MNKLSLLFTGILIAFGASWLGLVAYPVSNLGHLQPLVDEDTAGYFPPSVSGSAVAGQKVYASEGCVYCHSQQVRLDPTSTDIAKKLGVRQTVPRDYIRDKTAFLGKRRIGQDLSNVGTRIKEANDLHQYLYEPSTVTPGGKMPSYRYLYKKIKIAGQPSANAIQGLKGPHAPPAGYEVIPTEDAKALVAYLLSLNKNYPLPESPEPTAK